ncbi:CBS domain-containing protein [Mesorhizobium captivum]|uniref:CBS domain-containing protein n=1 Tax=Mesorhizobium captivum TaxID=3072319 RepID=A0ABU4YV68_9HYPH|nr:MULTISPECIES: CBS domain-containing protein [unclassified Mesorhizobium]MDX8446891.1 CBS domain-containing protein [Mesorhizobium sp. VK3C]MDX8490856.1 CBS domain-containing protein [Mesorhizobium sp. VK22B]MDX8504019.1 CBS domain-containing protein [Mesorhizobium sp. VK22E]
MKVQECMTRNVRIATLEASLRDVAQAMAVLDAGLIPVADNGRLVGIVTDRDIAIRGIAAGMEPDTPVRDVMSTDVKYCFEDEEVGAVLQDMGDIQVRRFLVLNRDKRLVGIVSLGDLVGNGETTHAGKALEGISQTGGQHSQAAAH